MAWTSVTVFLSSSSLIAAVLSIESPTFQAEELKKIQSALGIEVGSPIRPDVLRRGVVQLHANGSIQTVFIEVEHAPGGERVKITGTLRKKFRALVWEGISEAVQAEASGKLEFEAGKEIEPHSLTQARALVQRSLEEQGLFEAAVKIEIVPLATGDLADVRIAVASAKTPVIGKIALLGLPPGEQEEFRRLVTLRRGAPFDRDELRENVTKLNEYLRQNHYPTSRVEDAKLQFDAEQKVIDIQFIFRLGEKVQFLISGNTVFDEIQIRSLITEELLSQADALEKLGSAIRTNYQAVGYHFCEARITSEQKPGSSLAVKRVSIEEGPKVVIAKLEFRGGGGQISQGELEDLFYEQGSGVVSRGLYWEKGVTETLERMTDRIRRMGYLKAGVLSPKAVFSEDKKRATLFVDIELGIQTKVSSIQVSGNGYLATDKLLSVFPLKVGDQYDPNQLETGKRRLLELYQDEGFVNAKWVDQGETAFSIDSKEVSLKLQVVEGTRFFTGVIRLEGLRKTEAEVIERELKLHTGEPFSPQKVQQSEEAISTLGLFSRVEILVADDTNKKDVKNLVVLVRETAPGSGEVGLGGVYEDPRFRLRGFLGLSYKNLWGLNHTAFLRNEITLPISKEKTFPFVEYSSVVGFRAPYPFGLPLAGVFQLGLDRFEVSYPDSKLQTRARVEFKVEKRLSPRLMLNYRLLRYEFTKTEVLSSGATTRDYIGSTGPGLVLDLRDDSFNPREGSLHQLDIEFAHPILLSQSNISFISTLVRNTFYFPIGRNLGFAVYGGLGYAASLFADSALPTARRLGELSLGGQTSIRGFSVRRFFPDSAAKQSAMYNFRAEVTTRIFGDLSWAVFFDTGRIFPNLTARDSDPRHDGVGVGLRYRTPVGPVVLDVAQGLGKDRENIKFAFTIGTL